MKLATFRAVFALYIGCGAALGADAGPFALTATEQADRVSVRIGDKLFTEYVYPGDAKYPHFYPVNGPATGQSVTTRNTEPYPHHSSLFFGCDRVNGGNYWQEGLDRGQIRSERVTIIKAKGPEVVWEQECRWVRPGADAPLKDRRWIAVSAPDATRRVIDFRITLEAITDVTILKSNHSLFSARVAPDIAVTAGGELVNAEGGAQEAGTYGKRSAWCDFRGRRGGETEGIAIFSHPANPWSPPQWFTRDYGFFSPTPMQWIDDAGYKLASGNTLLLRYRVVVHSGADSVGDIPKWYAEWTTPAR